MNNPLPAPPAPRLRRPSWRDPRLAVGVLLVAGAVAAGSWVVSDASRTVPVYAAVAAITPGDAVDPGALRVVDVNLGAEEARYLRADRPLPDDQVALRVIGAGELVAVTALGDPDAVELRSVAVPVGSGMSDRIRKGATVDLWFVPEAPAVPTDVVLEPEPLVSGVVVEQVDGGDGGLVVTQRGTIHVLVGVEDLPGVLAALGAKGSIAVVPIAGS